MARRAFIALAIGAVALVGLSAQTGFNPFRQADGSNVSGQVLLCVPGPDRVAAPCGSPSSPLSVASVPAATTSGGLTVYRVSSPDGATPAVVKASPGRLYSFNLCNNAESARYVRFYDDSAPVVGATAVFAGAILVSAGTCQQFLTQFGLAFPHAISMSVTMANGDTDTSTTGAAAGDVSGFLGFM